MKRRAAPSRRGRHRPAFANRIAGRIRGPRLRICPPIRRVTARRKADAWSSGLLRCPACPRTYGLASSAGGKGSLQVTANRKLEPYSDLLVPAGASSAHLSRSVVLWRVDCNRLAAPSLFGENLESRIAVTRGLGASGVSSQQAPAARLLPRPAPLGESAFRQALSGHAVGIVTGVTPPFRGGLLLQPLRSPSFATP